MQRRLTLVLALIAIGAIAYSLLASGVHVPDRTALVIELNGAIEERPPGDWIERLSASGPALPTLLLQLEKAKLDSRIAAVVLRIRGVDAGFARCQELRGALEKLAEQKPLIAWLDIASLNATREFYLASAARQIFIAPGYLGPLAGVAGHYLNLKGLLDRIGIAVEAEKIGAYKSAPEMFTQREMSPEARAESNEILDGVFGELVAGIARGRKLDEAAVRKIIDAAPGTAQELVAAKLADGVAQRDELLGKAGLGELEELPVASYVDVNPGQFGLRSGPRIAVVFASGLIAPGGTGASFTPERIGGALDAAAEDDAIRAIVLRIDSGGGSSQASEAIWQRVVAARAKKPVVVSMGDAAASGGYYVAAGASSIVAQPTTLTGSIGVFFLRPSLQGLLQKYEVHSEVLSRGRFAGLGIADHDLTPAERERMRAIIHDQYQLFLQRVAAGRPLKTEEVDAVGQGRVWLGKRAKEIQLVDELGGLDRAVELAKQAAGIAADVDPQRVVLPVPEGIGQRLRALVGSAEWSWVPARIARELPEWIGAGATQLDGALYLPSLWIHLH